MTTKFIVFEDCEKYPMFVTYLIHDELGQFNNESSAYRFESQQEAQEVCDYLNESVIQDHGLFKISEVQI